MGTDLQVIPLSRQGRDLNRFLHFTYRVYGADPFWVAPILMDLRKVFSDANPLFEHAEMRLWIAVRGEREVGRIAGLHDHQHNKVQRDSALFFGFFECEDDMEAAAALFGAVQAWAREKGLRRVLGPMNPTSNDECGLLVEGFDSSPTLMMTYNPPYYARLIEGQGFVKARDLLAYTINLQNEPMDRLARLVERARKRWPELRFKPIQRRTLDQDLAKIKDIYNAAWEQNWGFVPMTNREVDFMAERLRPLLHVDISWLAETDREPVGFLLALPDYNVAFKPLRGHLLTPAIFKALPYLLNWKTPSACRVITLGVKEAYRGKGVESVMLFEGLRVGFKAGFTSAEASWVLEDNVMMNRLMEVYAGRVYKRYRIYERQVKEAS